MSLVFRPMPDAEPVTTYVRAMMGPFAIGKFLQST